MSHPASAVEWGTVAGLRCLIRRLGIEIPVGNDPRGVGGNHAANASSAETVHPEICGRQGLVRRMGLRGSPAVQVTSAPAPTLIDTLGST